MAEEFQESEVIFHHHDKNNYFISYREMAPNHQHHAHVVQENSSVSCNSSKKSSSKKKKKPVVSSTTVPVNIPNNVIRIGDRREDIEDSDDEYGEMDPPHVIVGRRVGTKMAFSVCTGYGRTLKGRDLSEVRNSILRLTGFLET